MRRLGWLVVVSLVAGIPAVGFAEKPVRPPPPPIGGPGGGPDVPPEKLLTDANYKAPKADGAVVELLDEGTDSLFPVLTNDGGGEAGTITREDRDVFAGVEAVRVTPMQKYRSRIPGWDFKIVEKPQKPGEFRYMRFAWKKIAGVGVMIQLHDPVKSWAMRYHCGTNIYGWDPTKQVSVKLPGEWQLVTVDLFKDYGEFTITGLALSPLDGTAALYDHMLLGRTVEDLDKATQAALGRVKPAKALDGKERDTLWEDLVGTDRAKAAVALRAFLATAPDQVAYVREKLAAHAGDKDERARIRKLVADLDSDSFDTRENAVAELIKIGAPALDAVRALAERPPNDEVAYRVQLILRKLNTKGAPVAETGRMARVVRVLERAGSKAAQELLWELAEGEYGFAAAGDARAALARMPKTP